MRYKIIATRTITKKAIFETIISPGFYIAITIGLLLGFFLVSGFIDSIGSSGFMPEQNVMYELITKTITGIFGETLVIKLFSEGPFLFALFISFLPVLVYLAFSSVFKFGHEKNVGAIEMIVYGPADGTTYFLGYLIKNLLLTGLYLFILLIFFIISALLHNLVLGPTFFFAQVLIFFMALAVYAYSTITAVITENAASGVTLFLIIFLVFALLQIGSFALVSGYVKDLAGTFARVLQWFSPVYYWNYGLDLVEYGKITLYLLDLLYLFIVSFVLLFFSHLILKLKGVRE